jgi:hypothetical protein
MSEVVHEVPFVQLSPRRPTSIAAIPPAGTTTVAT